MENREVATNLNLVNACYDLAKKHETEAQKQYDEVDKLLTELRQYWHPHANLINKEFILEEVPTSETQEKIKRRMLKDFISQGKLPWHYYGFTGLKREHIGRVAKIESLRLEGVKKNQTGATEVFWTALVLIKLKDGETYGKATYRFSFVDIVDFNN